MGTFLEVMELELAFRRPSRVGRKKERSNFPRGMSRFGLGEEPQLSLLAEYRA